MKLLNSERISKRDWRLNGGFANPRCWRRQVGKAWQYYYRRD